jgi:predicted RNA-binding Zn-ribbon protein involved in translation (DUF1610 family)
MFKNLMSELKNLKSVSVPIEADPKGYIDKQCPSQECEFRFKVNKEDWGNLFHDEAVWCPQCKHEAPANQWFTKEQASHATKEALSVVGGVIHNAILEDANDFNRWQNNKSFISMSMKVSGGKKRIYALPAEAAEEMQLEIQCERCNSRFAVVGSAYFCPACGHNSVERTFFDSLRKITAKTANIEIVRAAIEKSVSKDEAELTCKSLIETCISDGVVAFQKLCDGLYETHGQAPFNAFQRLEQSEILWRKLYTVSYSEWLKADEYAELKIIYQKRHLLAHNEGIVDDRYVTKSGDIKYKPGQRLVITINDIDVMVNCLNKLATQLLARRGNE